MIGKIIVRYPVDQPAQSRLDGGHVHDLDAWTKAYGTFERLSIDAPSLSVDTTDGYAPDLPQIVAFVGD